MKSAKCSTLAWPSPARCPPIPGSPPCRHSPPSPAAAQAQQARCPATNSLQSAGLASLISPPSPAAPTSTKCASPATPRSPPRAQFTGALCPASLPSSAIPPLSAKCATPEVYKSSANPPQIHHMRAAAESVRSSCRPGTASLANPALCPSPPAQQVRAPAHRHQVQQVSQALRFASPPLFAKPCESPLPPKPKTMHPLRIG